MRFTRLKLLRQQRGLLQVEVQLRTGIARCRLSAIENAYVTPTDGELRALAKARGCTVDDLLRDEGTRPAA